MMQRSQHRSARWIAVDWGTSNLRVWVMDQHNQILQALQSERGMKFLSRVEFEPVLTDLISDWLPTGNTTLALPVVACGMLGSRQGWHEAPYRAVPCQPLHTILPPAFQAAQMQVTILPGLKQDNPPDVMRGEETQIAGFLHQNPSYSGLLCLPGSHTKWVQLHAGVITSFRTFMTGELFQTLSAHTVLRHSLETKAWDQQAFLTAVQDALRNPDSLTADLFSLRAGHLLHERSAARSRAGLSGLLIGAELAVTRPVWPASGINIIGSDRIATLYQQALRSQGHIATVADASGMTIKGLTAAYNRLEPQS